jgi:transcriptional regulator with XRE-family HTH domain
MAAVFSDDSKRGHHPQARTPRNDGPGIGELFRGAREHLGLTLEQVSRETKIPRRHLDALEHGTLAALPPFYQRAEIRTYARVLNLDPGPVLARLERGMAPSVAPNESPKPSARHTPTFSRNHRALIAAGFVLTAIVFWRAMPRDVSLGAQSGGGQVADSAKPIGSLPATHAAARIDRTEFDQNRQPSASTERVLRGGIEPTDARPTVAANGDLPITAEQGDERPSVESATQLIVTTEPAGARVTVDGIGWGVTPVTIRYLPPGNKRIRVSKEGYATTERVVGLAEGRHQTTDIRLENSLQTDF